MPKLLQLIFLLFLSSCVRAQETVVMDSLKKLITTTTEVEKKVNLINQLASFVMNTSAIEADKYGNEAIQIAELSRDRKAIVQALLGNAVRLIFL